MRTTHNVADGRIKICDILHPFPFFEALGMKNSGLVTHPHDQVVQGL